MGLLRFTVKSTVAGGIIYYTIQQGLWSSSEESTKLYVKMYNTIAPYVKQNMPQEVVDEIAVLPSVTDLTNFTKGAWNGGVIKSMRFLSNVPTHVRNGTSTLSSTVTSYLDQSSRSEESRPAV